MNFREIWDTYPQWSEIFTELDFLMVDSLERITGPVELTTEMSLATLLLAKAVRLNHVALSLKNEELGRVLHEQLWTFRDDDGDFVTADNKPTPDEVRNGVRSLVALESGVIERRSLLDPVDSHGPPLLLSYDQSGDAYLAYRRYAYAEEVVTRAILDSARSPHSLEGVASNEVLSSLGDITLSERGAQAISNALQRRLSVLTGGPGRGKTTIVASLLMGLRRHAEAHGRTYTVALCAPTAKAAVRMLGAVSDQLAAFGETLDDLSRFVSIDERSGSVHRLLGIRPDNTKSLRSLQHDFVIVDEISMLEFTLLAKLIEHAPNTHLVLVGDADQLASVNIGAALRDIVDGAEAVGLENLVTRLVENYRSNKVIDTLAQAINSGNANEALAIMARETEIIHRVGDTKAVFPDVFNWARQLRDAANRRDVETCFRLLSEQTVLCATHHGQGSVGWWRDSLSRYLAADGDTTAGTRFQPGTPVLVTENEQSIVVGIEQRLSNGDVGVAIPEENSMSLIFGPPTATRTRRENELGRAEAAWSTTIHKSQGSEYVSVVVSLPHASSRILTKELLYTAVTRAKEKVTIIGTDEAVRAAIERTTFRASGLVDRLRARA